MRLVALVIMLFASLSACACDIEFQINLKTLGETVTVELRKGTPGHSRIVSSKQSSGGRVRFDGICPGNYFLAIGDDNYVSVTPVRTFEEGHGYESNIRLQRGHGNVEKKSRSGL